MTPAPCSTDRTATIGGHDWTTVAVDDPELAGRFLGYHQAATILSGTRSQAIEQLVAQCSDEQPDGWRCLAVPVALRDQAVTVIEGQPSPVFTGTDPVDMWRPRQSKRKKRLAEKHLPRKLQVQGILHSLAVGYLRAGQTPPAVYPAATDMTHRLGLDGEPVTGLAGARFAAQFHIASTQPIFQEEVAGSGAPVDEEVGRLAPDSRESLFLLFGRPRRSGMVPRATVWGPLWRDHVDVHLRTDGRILLTSQPYGMHSDWYPDDVIKERAAYGIAVTLLGPEHSLVGDGTLLTVIEQAVEPPQLEPIYDLHAP